jgi:hypothetical protein
LEAKVKAIREKNLPPEKWSVADLNAMLQWYKNPSNTAVPTKKADKLAIQRGWSFYHCFLLFHLPKALMSLLLTMTMSGCFQMLLLQIRKKKMNCEG